MDTDAAARRWAGVWHRGWAEGNAEPIIALYTEDALFFWHPFLEPSSPREHVLDVVDGNGEVDPWFGEPVVEGERATVEWRAIVKSHGEEVTFAGVSLLRFRDDGQCTEEREVWMRTEGQIERF